VRVRPRRMRVNLSGRDETIREIAQRPGPLS
jgi:hypothetical protein